MLHGDTYIDQRTFNEINTHPSVLNPTTRHMMDNCEPTSPPPKRRGRKRQSEDDNMTEEERLKKQKNREAAKKCREKKEKEAKELKTKNQELENENKGLAEEKKKLEEKVKNYMKVIKTHLSKGCKLPPQVQALWNQESQCLDTREDMEMENFRAVGTIETHRAPTPPRTPEHKPPPVSPPARRRSSVSPASTFSGPTPTALFSGTPLPEGTMIRKRSCSGTSSSASSCSPTPSPPPMPFRQTGYPSQQKDLNHFLSSKTLPPALAPIPSSASKTETKPYFPPVSYHQGSPQQRASPAQTVPTVVTEANHNRVDSKTLVKLNGSTYILDGETTDETGHRTMYLTPIQESDSATSMQTSRETTYNIPSRETTYNIPSREVLEKPFEQPEDIPTEDEVSKAMYNGMSQRNGHMNNSVYSTAQNVQENQVPESGQNLSSMGFICMETEGPPAGYSYTEDLQRSEPAEEIIQYTTMSNQPMHRNGRNENAVNESTKTEDIPLVGPMAPAAMLDMWKEMTPALREQIKTSMPGNNFTGTVSQTTNQSSPMEVEQTSQEQEKQQQQQRVQQWVNQGAVQVHDRTDNQSVGNQVVAPRHPAVQMPQSTSGPQNGTKSLQSNEQYQRAQTLSGQPAYTSPHPQQIPTSAGQTVQQKVELLPQTAAIPRSNGYSIPNSQIGFTGALLPQTSKDTLSWTPIQETKPQSSATVYTSSNASVTSASASTTRLTSYAPSENSDHVVPSSNKVTYSAVSSQSSEQQSPTSAILPASALVTSAGSALGSLDIGLPSLNFNEMSDPNIFNKKAKPVQPVS